MADCMETVYAGVRSVYRSVVEKHGLAGCGLGCDGAASTIPSCC
jgi:hypothetical protein